MQRIYITMLLAFMFKTPLFAQTAQSKDIPDGMYAMGHTQKMGTTTFPVDSHTYVYDANGHMLSDTEYVFNFSTTYPKSKIYTYTYDSIGRLIQFTFDYWDQNLQSPRKWSNRILTYNSFGKVASDNFNIWDKNTQAYEPKTRDLYTYDGSGLLIKMVNQDWQNGFATMFTETYTYDGNGNLKTKKRVDPFNNGDYEYNVFIYDANNRVICDSDYVYDKFTDKLYLRYCSLTTYDGAGRIFTRKRYSYQPIPGTLNGITLDTIFYNTNGTWQAVNRYSGTTTMVALSPIKYSYNSNFSIITKTMESDVQNYYFNQSVLGVKDETISHRLAMYPNPAQELVYLNLPINQSCAVNIYSISGMLVYKTMLDANGSQQTLDISGLSSGSYVVEVIVSSNVYRSVLIRN